MAGTTETALLVIEKALEPYALRNEEDATVLAPEIVVALVRAGYLEAEEVALAEGMEEGR